MKIKTCWSAEMHTTSHHQLSIKKKLSKFFSSRKIKQNKTKKQTNKIDSANRTWMSENILCENVLYFHIISDIFIPTSSVKNIPTCSSMSTWFTNFWTLPSLLNTWLRTMSADFSHLYKESRKYLSAILAAPIPFGENYFVLDKVFSFLIDHSIAEVLSLYWIVL